MLCIIIDGVPVVVLDLCLLVQDVDIAAECLLKAGWVIDNTQGPFKNQQRRGGCIYPARSPTS
jgi:hypothetical protein